nr:LytTR family DNA-binding domain-containing protein [uncultured Psychroserpens sp.]
MTAYKIIVADDESLTRDRISNLLKDYRNFKIVKETSNGVETLNAIRLYKPDVIFLDIKMPLLNGFEVLQELSKNDYKLLVFVTAFDDYAIKAFENEAIDYLLKPFNDGRFAKLMERVNRYLSPLHEEPIIVIKEKNDIFRVLTKDIIYIEAENNYVNIILEDCKYKMRISMTNILNKLNHNFVKIHRSFIINKHQIKKMKHVKSGDYLFLMSNNKSLFSSKSYRPSIKALLG